MLCIIMQGRVVECMTYSLLLLLGGGALSAGLLLALPLLEESLRDQNLVVGGDGTICKDQISARSSIPGAV
jgi:hypothetical protein